MYKLSDCFEFYVTFGKTLLAAMKLFFKLTYQSIINIIPRSNKIKTNYFAFFSLQGTFIITFRIYEKNILKMNEQFVN